MDDVRPGQVWCWRSRYDDDAPDTWSFIVIVLCALDGPSDPEDWCDCELTSVRFYKTYVIAGAMVGAETENYWPDGDCWRLIADVV